MLLHPGQHYDDAMKAAFAEPDVDLGVGSASLVQITSRSD
jgi:hypothetical protein